MSKWAVVTGATAGIGESFTRILAHDGFNIVLVARDLERMKERAAHLESQFKVQTAIIQADLATDNGCAVGFGGRPSIVILTRPDAAP